MSATPVPAVAGVPDADAGQRHFLFAFGRLVAPFWRTGAARRAWLLLAVVIVGLIVDANVAFMTNVQAGALTNAIVTKSGAGIAHAAWLTLALAAAAVALNILQSYCTMLIEIDWRLWLTDSFTGRWLSDRNYYRIERDHRLDNVDQRITQDVFLFLDRTIQFGADYIDRLTKMAVYSFILWSLAGPLTVAVGGARVSIPNGAFFLTWIGLVLIFLLMLLVGRPLLRLTVQQQRREADYRFALVNLRMNAEQVALYDGASTERSRFDALFSAIVANWKRIMWAAALVTFFAALYGSFLPVFGPLPGLAAYLGGSIDFGQLSQVSLAVGSIAMTLTLFVSMMRAGAFFEWAASIRRLDALDVELSRPQATGIAVASPAGGDAGVPITTRGLSLALPDGRPLTAPGDVSFEAAGRWLVRGPSGSGKSTMMRAMAGLWPYGSGEVAFEAAARARTMFLPQKGYIPTGPLVAALSYPAAAGTFDREDCAEMLRLVGLDGLVRRLDEDAAWQQQLSPGEQQQLAFAAVFLHRPDVVLLDEATSALDTLSERRMYSLLRDRLPHALVISIAHGDTLDEFHDRTLTFDATGARQR